MLSLKITPNLTKNWNLPKVLRLLSQSLGCRIKSHIVQNIYDKLVFTWHKGLLIVSPNKKVSRFAGLFSEWQFINKITFGFNSWFEIGEKAHQGKISKIIFQPVKCGVRRRSKRFCEPSKGTARWTHYHKGLAGNLWTLKSAPSRTEGARARASAALAGHARRPKTSPLCHFTRKKAMLSTISDFEQNGAHTYYSENCSEIS